MIICYIVPEIRHVTEVIFIFNFNFNFFLILILILFFQKWKKYLEISSFYFYEPKIIIT